MGLVIGWLGLAGYSPGLIAQAGQPVPQTIAGAETVNAEGLIGLADSVPELILVDSRNGAGKNTTI